MDLTLQCKCKIRVPPYIHRAPLPLRAVLRRLAQPPAHTPNIRIHTQKFNKRTSTRHPLTGPALQPLLSISSTTKFRRKCDASLLTARQSPPPRPPPSLERQHGPPVPLLPAMEQPPEPHPVRLRRPPPGGDPRRRDPGLRRDLGARPQGGAERLLALLPAHLLREPLQAPGDRPQGLQRLGGAGHSRFHVQGGDQRGAGAASEPDQGGGELAGTGVEGF